MPVVDSRFRPAWWLPGAHLQTLWPTFFRSRPKLSLRTERLELPDGDFLDLAWSGADGAPLVLVLHGLEGSLNSHYAAGIIDTLTRHGYRVCFLHFRGCSGEPNRLARSYHSGDTADLRRVAEHIREEGGRPLRAAIGFSLGGNVLLKWLAETGAAAPVACAVAASVPFRLDDAARRLDQGVSRVYQRHLLRLLITKFKTKFAARECPLDVRLDEIRDFYAFDDAVTAPLHGFDGVDDYYARSSSRQYLRDIQTPTLILHARDDPFMFPDTVPAADELSPSVRLELARQGGHVGFVQGRWPWRPDYWIDQRVVDWLLLHEAADVRDTSDDPAPGRLVAAPAQVKR